MSDAALLFSYHSFQSFVLDLSSPQATRRGTDRTSFYRHDDGLAIPDEVEYVCIGYKGGELTINWPASGAVGYRPACDVSEWSMLAVGVGAPSGALSVDAQAA